MTERRTIKQRSPAVWARVKAAYLAGEPAASVARRFDVGYGNLRFRANAEGWTRKAAMAAAEQEAEAEDRRLAGEADVDEPLPRLPPLALPPEAPVPPEDLHEALEAATRRAASLLARGRAAEASALLKAAEALDRRIGTPPPEADRADDAAATPPEAPVDDIAAEEDLYRLRAELESHILSRADETARLMLSDLDTAPNLLGALALHWRAENLGPECAALDFVRHREDGRPCRYWNADGSLKSLDEIFDGWWETVRNQMRGGAGLPYRKEWVRPEGGEGEEG
ncbi:MAG: hypothetical protein Q8S53_03745 [Brevundimonas sp.]|uniref:hypothetical protein n=1 Tax=Brevundimonas sp. TaxID=1871086 RepID=UPI00273763B9|nr:hypothetical protein [Brevundimonas sp.]MDP3377453.1 hypothetical protein [Brevundimonas sp.]